MPFTDTKGVSKLPMIYLVFAIDSRTKTEEVVEVCSTYDLALEYMNDHEGVDYCITYKGEGWPLDHYARTK